MTRSRSSLVTTMARGIALLGCDPPQLLGLDFYAVDAGDHEEGEVGCPQRGPGITREVAGARCVDEVDGVALPLE